MTVSATPHSGLAAENSPDRAAAAGRTAILLAGLFITGVIVFLYGYYVWRFLIDIPLELPGGVTLNGELRKVRPWAPWWIMPSITALIGMLLWRWIAQRRQRISLLGAASAYVLATPASFMVATFCLELGAISQYVPRPPLMKIVVLLPLIFVEALAVTFINLLLHGLALIPLAAFLGMAVAGIVRLALLANAPATMGILSVAASIGAILLAANLISKIDAIDRSPPGTFADTVERMQTGNPNAQAPDPGPEPWAGPERSHAKDVRELARGSTVEALAQHATQPCDKKVLERLLGRFGYYLEQRGMQQRGYPITWGEPGRRFITEAWGTPDDLMIERRMRELYEAGYFSTDRYKSKGEIVPRILGDVAAPSGTACSG